MEGPKPTEENVPAKTLDRFGPINNISNTKKIAITPSEDATPRTLIDGILCEASVSKSGLFAPQTRKSKVIRSPSTGSPAKRYKATRRSLGDNATPRTIIKNFLLEATPETPLEVPLEYNKEELQGKSIATSSQTPNNLPETQLEVSSKPVKDDLLDEDTVGSSQTPSHDVQDQELSQISDATLEEEDTDQNGENFPKPDNGSMVFVDNAKVGEMIIAQGDSENQEKEDPEVLNPTPNKESDISAVLYEGTNEFPIQTPHDQESHELEGINDTDTNTEHPDERWKELVTSGLSVRKRNFLSEKQQVINERTSKAVKKPPSAKETTKVKSVSNEINLPTSLVKSMFQHFSKSKISKNTLDAIQKGSSVFFKQVSSDLMAYSKHARRSTVEMGDVELLMKRQGFITDKQSLNSLIEKYLPLEYRQELIAIAQSGNKVVLKKSN